VCHGFASRRRRCTVSSPKLAWPQAPQTKRTVNLSSWIAVPIRRTRCSRRTGRRRLKLGVLEDRVAPATLTVNTLADSTGGSQLSLRDAILAVDGGSYSGPATGQVSGTFGSNDTIQFQSGAGMV